MTERDNIEEQSSVGPIIVDDNLVTESLLSWAKDVRYVRAIQSLLAQASEPLLSHQLAPSTLTKGTWYTSYLLYVLIMMSCHGRTLGMKATGLEFAISKKNSSRHGLIGALLALGATTWALDYWASKNDRQAESQSEGLRGNERQRRHELLRQQMLQRATSSQSTEVHSNRSHHRQTSGVLSYQSRLAIKVQQLVKSLIKSIGESTRDGPHNPPRNYDGSTRAISVATWLLRLHLAQYLITGKFPTMFHRILGLEHTRESTTSRVPVQPGTHRVVALLIAIQGSASIMRYCLNWWTKRVALYLEARARARNKTYAEHNKTSANTSHTTHPIVSTCAICRASRKHPAVSANCGHVFCWACLRHWVSSVKEACPYCRSPCRLEDIQPLYNYDHFATMENNERAKTS